MNKQDEPRKPPQSIKDLQAGDLHRLDSKELGDLLRKDPDVATGAVDEAHAAADLAFEVYKRLGCLEPKVHAAMKERIYALAADFEILLELPPGDDETRAKVVAFVALFEDRDDDDSEEAPSPVPKDDVPVPA